MMKRLLLLLLFTFTLFTLSACQISSIEIIARENARQSLNLLSDHVDDSIDIISLSYEGGLISYRVDEGFNEEKISYFIIFDKHDTEAYAIVNYHYRYDPHEDRERPDATHFSIELYDEMTVFEAEMERRSVDIDAWLSSYYEFYDDDDFYYEHDQITFDPEEIEAFLE